MSRNLKEIWRSWIWLQEEMFTVYHGRMNYKDTKPYMSAFPFSWPVNRLYGILFNRFYRLEIHSLMVCIFDPACELLLPWTKELYLCTFALLLYLLSVDHILQEFYTLFLTRFRTYKIASPPQTKMTSKDDIKGLMSLKFLHPCRVPLGTVILACGLVVNTYYNVVELHNFCCHKKKWWCNSILAWTNCFAGVTYNLTSDNC